MSFVVRAAGVVGVVTGDTILGRGTTVVAHPDGQLGPYLESLARLGELRGALLLPGHGPVQPDVAPVAAEYLAHRYQRLGQVRAALAAGARTPREVVEIVYADVDRMLWPAAEQSVRAQLDYLTNEAAEPATNERLDPADTGLNAPAGATAQCRVARPNAARAATIRARRSRRAPC